MGSQIIQGHLPRQAGGAGAGNIAEDEAAAAGRPITIPNIRPAGRQRMRRASMFRQQINLGAPAEILPGNGQPLPVRRPAGKGQAQAESGRIEQQTAMAAVGAGAPEPAGTVQVYKLAGAWSIIGFGRMQGG